MILEDIRRYVNRGEEWLEIFLNDFILESFGVIWCIEIEKSGDNFEDINNRKAFGNRGGFKD